MLLNFRRNKGGFHSASNHLILREKLSVAPNAGVPLLVPWKWKWVSGILLCGLTLLAYLYSNHQSISHAQVLNLTWIDREIPFLPWTVWIYLSGIPYLFFVYLLNRCVISLNIHLYSFFTLVLISVLIFLIFPILYPRELYPLPDHGVDPWSRKILEWMRSVDRPTNCAPSLHVSISYLISLGFLEDRRRYFLPVFLWSTLLSISTLTLKQHYLVDVISGVGLAVLLHWIFHHKLSYRLWSDK